MNELNQILFKFIWTQKYLYTFFDLMIENISMEKDNSPV